MKTTSTTTTLSEGTLKALALLQHKGEQYFVITDSQGYSKAYLGTEKETLSNYFDYLKGDEFAGNPNPITFAEYCSNELTEVEEYDTDDYNNDYLVLTDEEADDRWEEELESYIEECIMPEIDKLNLGNLSYYIKFDEEAWKSDARMDGRGHVISRYDGAEHEETVYGVTYYIYRMN
jgi:hypothetical protein